MLVQAAAKQGKRKRHGRKAEIERLHNPGTQNPYATRIDLIAGFSIDAEPTDQIRANVARIGPFATLLRIAASARNRGSLQ